MANSVGSEWGPGLPSLDPLEEGSVYGAEDGVNQNAGGTPPSLFPAMNHTHPPIFLHWGTEISTSMSPRYSPPFTSLLIALGLW